MHDKHVEIAERLRDRIDIELNDVDYSEGIPHTLIILRAALESWIKEFKK